MGAHAAGALRAVREGRQLVSVAKQALTDYVGSLSQNEIDALDRALAVADPPVPAL
jgi:hypothetical protein